MARILLLLLTLSLMSGGLVAQVKDQPQSSNPWSFGANAYYGAIFQYRKGTPLLNFTNPYGIELYGSLQTTGKREWERMYKHPKIGFSASYYNYGVPDELGEAFSLTSYFDNYITKGRKNALRLNLGTGFVYHTKYYKPETNELNSAIGSKICFSLRGTLYYEIPLQEKLFLNLNLAFRHFSNGGLNKPNNGMNFPLIGLGVRYQPQPVQIAQHEGTQKSAIDKRIRYNLKLATGRKEVLLVDEKHPVYSIVFYASKKLTRFSGVMVGADGRWDTSLRNEFISDHLTPPEGTLDPKMAGITVGHELYIGDVSFIIQLGHYIYKPYDIFPAVYQRYGLQYYVTKNLSVSGMLVAHTRTADHAEFGIGIHL